MMDRLGRFKLMVPSVMLVAAALVAGCGSGGEGGSQAGVGTLGVSLTDAPACGFDQVNVTVSKVRVHQSGNAGDNAAGWSDIVLNPPRTINLLTLNDPTQPNFALENLGEMSLTAGHYTQVRLVLVDNVVNQPTANWVVLAGTNPMNDKIALETPSAIRSGIKLINQFTVNPRQRVDLLLDFDACHSIVKTGNGKYILKPVIKVIPYVLNGIEGFVDANLLSSNVVVSAQGNDGEIVRAAVPNTSTDLTKRGKFFLAYLPAGVSYNVVITADNHATKIILGVPVPTDTSITAVSSNAMPAPPITLEPSPSGDIGGIVTVQSGTDDQVVFVLAKQTFGSGPTVTVKSQVATIKTDTPAVIGDYGYALTLPTGAPSLGSYVTPLPIVFAPQALVANTYTVQASSAGYVTASASNLSTGAVQDFNLSLAP